MEPSEDDERAPLIKDLDGRLIIGGTEPITDEIIRQLVDEDRQ